MIQLTSPSSMAPTAVAPDNGRFAPSGQEATVSFAKLLDASVSQDPEEGTEALASTPEAAETDAEQDESARSSRNEVDAESEWEEEKGKQANDETDPWITKSDVFVIVADEGPALPVQSAHVSGAPDASQIGRPASGTLLYPAAKVDVLAAMTRPAQDAKADVSAKALLSVSDTSIPRQNSQMVVLPMPQMAVPVLQTVPGEADAGVPLAEDEILQLLSQSQTQSQPASPVTPAVTRPLAPQVATQIAMALVQSSGATTEISLNPEELGRVRIALTSTDTGLTVSILAERPETADLMRRNLEILAREFQDIGYTELTFSFGHSGGDGTEAEADNPTGTNGATPSLSAAETAVPAAVAVASGGLDLKL